MARPLRLESIRPMHFNLDPSTVFLTLSGSHAYGMAGPDSDVDIRGVCIPPREIRDSVFKTFEQYTAATQEASWGPNSVQALNRLAVHDTASLSYMKHQNIDLVVFGLQKFLKLAANANPNILELLFVAERDVLFRTPVWELAREQRDLFLSKKCKHTFLGYAHSQLRRIKGHREWLLHPPQKEPMRADFGLPEESVLPADIRNTVDEAVKKVLREWEMEDDIEITGASQDVFRERVRDFYGSLLKTQSDDYEDQMYHQAAVSIGVPAETLSVIKAERSYRMARKGWQQFQKWKQDRNPARAELEAKFGFDCKHGSHLIRLMRMGLEILRDGEVQVRRPDAKELLSIRRGELSYDELIEQAESIEREVEEAAKHSTLPRAPNMEAIDNLYRQMLDMGVSS